LDSIYIPFTIVIVSIGFLYYSFLIVAPFESGNKKLLRIITCSVFCTAFVLTLIMMIIPIIWHFRWWKMHYSWKKLNCSIDHLTIPIIF
jgi:membrane protein YdbS with pleckstrin-like domain